MTQEALKLALEALENSVDLVVEDAYNAEKLYGNYPTRQGKVGGLKILADQHKQAIAAIKEALAQPTSSDYALGYSIGFGEGHSAGKALAQPEQEPVAWEQFYPDIGKPQIEFAPVKIVAYNCTCGRTMKFESVHGVVAPQRTFVGLTDIDYAGLPLEQVGLVRWAEAKLKELNT